MALPIISLKEHALRGWNQSSCASLRTGEVFSREQQVQKEGELDSLMRSIDEAQSAGRGAPNETKRRLIAVRSRVQKSIVQLLHSFGCVIDDEMEGSFSGVTDEFIREAYDFDPSISEEAVYQASRNVMIMNTFQMHLGKVVALTPSIFAYSLLYPYTDNYLDAAEVDRPAKHAANARLGLRLSGIECPARNRNDEIVDSLVEMIEGEFDRSAFPLVYESLLAIHHAQTRSVFQQGTGRRLSACELRDVSFEKGGTSVLADGYLVAGNLSDEDMQFFFDFGVLLQLIDDLQDLEEDCALGQRTIVGEEAEHGMLDMFTNRFLSYMSTTLSSPLQKEKKLYQLIERSCQLLVLEAVASHNAHYNRAYLENMERQSPLRFEYLREVRCRLRRGERERELQGISRWSRRFVVAGS